MVLDGGNLEQIKGFVSSRWFDLWNDPMVSFIEPDLNNELTGLAFPSWGAPSFVNTLPLLWKEVTYND